MIRFKKESSGTKLFRDIPHGETFQLDGKYYRKLDIHSGYNAIDMESGFLKSINPDRFVRPVNLIAHEEGGPK